MNNKSNTVAATIFWRETFQIGDMICHEHNYNQGHIFFFKATDLDVETISGKNGLYAVIVNH